jgi:hypothetical protein
LRIKHLGGNRLISFYFLAAFSRTSPHSASQEGAQACRRDGHSADTKFLCYSQTAEELEL